MGNHGWCFYRAFRGELSAFLLAFHAEPAGNPRPGRFGELIGEHFGRPDLLERLSRSDLDGRSEAAGTPLTPQTRPPKIAR